MVDVCFAVAIARPELAYYSRLHKLWPSNFGRGMLRGETVPRSIERYRTIIEVNRVAIVETAPEKVFCGMCAALKKVMPCDRAGLTVYDPEHDALKIAALYGRYENSFFRVGDFLRRNDSQNGWTFEHQSGTLRRDLAKEHQFALEKHTLEEGFLSLCSVPLVVYGKGVGVVTILSQQKNQYSHRHGQYLQDVANQIALLVAMLAPHCTHHPQSKLLCPRCIASAGGRTTTAKYKEQLSAWGQKGGRRKKEGGEL
ncbi:MAG: GAF domain-containing protein [Acidobacteriota bacterium]